VLTSCFKAQRGDFQTRIMRRTETSYYLPPSTLFFFPTCCYFISFRSFSFFCVCVWARVCDDDAFYTQLARNNSVEQHHGRPGRKPACRQRIRASMAITFWKSRFLRYLGLSCWQLLVGDRPNFPWQLHKGSRHQTQDAKISSPVP
jgi:hypothetical protein